MSYYENAIFKNNSNINQSVSLPEEFDNQFVDSFGFPAFSSILSKRDIHTYGHWIEEERTVGRFASIDSSSLQSHNHCMNETPADKKKEKEERKNDLNDRKKKNEGEENEKKCEINSMENKNNGEMENVNKNEKTVEKEKIEMEIVANNDRKMEKESVIMKEDKKKEKVNNKEMIIRITVKGKEDEKKTRILSSKEEKIIDGIENDNNKTQSKLDEKCNSNDKHMKSSSEDDDSSENESIFSLLQKRVEKRTDNMKDVKKCSTISSVSEQASKSISSLESTPVPTSTTLSDNKHVTSVPEPKPKSETKSETKSKTNSEPTAQPTPEPKSNVTNSTILIPDNTCTQTPISKPDKVNIPKPEPSNTPSPCLTTLQSSIEPSKHLDIAQQKPSSDKKSEKQQEGNKSKSIETSSLPSDKQSSQSSSNTSSQHELMANTVDNEKKRETTTSLPPSHSATTRKSRWDVKGPSNQPQTTLSSSTSTISTSSSQMNQTSYGISNNTKEQSSGTTNSSNIETPYVYNYSYFIPQTIQYYSQQQQQQQQSFPYSQQQQQQQQSYPYYQQLSYPYYSYQQYQQAYPYYYYQQQQQQSYSNNNIQQQSSYYPSQSSSSFNQQYYNSTTQAMSPSSSSVMNQYSTISFQPASITRSVNNSSQPQPEKNKPVVPSDNKSENKTAIKEEAKPLPVAESKITPTVKQTDHQEKKQPVEKKVEKTEDTIDNNSQSMIVDNTNTKKTEKGKRHKEKDDNPSQVEEPIMKESLDRTKKKNVKKYIDSNYLSPLRKINTVNQSIRLDPKNIVNTLANPPITSILQYFDIRYSVKSLSMIQVSSGTNTSYMNDTMNSPLYSQNHSHKSYSHRLPSCYASCTTVNLPPISN